MVSSRSPVIPPFCQTTATRLDRIVCRIEVVETELFLLCGLKNVSKLTLFARRKCPQSSRISRPKGRALSLTRSNDPRLSSEERLEWRALPAWNGTLELSISQNSSLDEIGCYSSGWLTIRPKYYRKQSLPSARPPSFPAVRTKTRTKARMMKLTFTLHLVEFRGIIGTWIYKGREERVLF